MRRYVILILSLLLLTGCSLKAPEETPAMAETPIEAPEPEPTETEPEPTEPEPTETEPEPTETEPTETEPEPTEPDPTEPEPEPQYSPAEEILSGMSLFEKLCQLFIVAPENAGGYPVGGLIYSARHLETVEQTARMIADAQSGSKLGLFVSVDEEGGIVNRVMGTLGTTWFDSMYYYKDDGEDTAYSNAFTIASDISALGFNLDFAPVADVWSDAANDVIGVRAYSDDYQQAASLVAAAVRGLSDGGVLCTLKHFPGHGEATGDSHEGAVTVNKTLDELLSGELLPFISGMEAGADMVMVGHLIIPSLGELPASLSSELITGVLRGELGWGGVVITDSLSMQAVTDNYSSGEAALLALNAGADILLTPQSLEDAINALISAIDDGSLTVERVNESVLRIVELKLAAGITQGVVERD